MFTANSTKSFFWLNIVAMLLFLLLRSCARHSRFGPFLLIHIIEVGVFAIPFTPWILWWIYNPYISTVWWLTNSVCVYVWMACVCSIIIWELRSHIHNMNNFHIGENWNLDTLLCSLFKYFGKTNRDATIYSTRATKHWPGTRLWIHQHGLDRVRWFMVQIIVQLSDFSSVVILFTKTCIDFCNVPRWTKCHLTFCLFIVFVVLIMITKTVVETRQHFQK